MPKRNLTQTSFYCPDEQRNVRPTIEYQCWTPSEQALFENDNEAYQKEQERRRLAGQKPIIICMGGPYSDAWYPPLQ